MSEEKEKNYVVIKEAVVILGFSRQTIYRMIERGDLFAKKIGKEWRISKNSIDKYLEIS
jgi:excisionase family DNA binding protein